MTIRISPILFLLCVTAVVRASLDFDYDFTEITPDNKVVNKQDSNGDVISLTPLPGTGSDNPVLSLSPEGIYLSGNAGAWTACDDSTIGTANGFAAWIFPLTQTSSNPFIIGFVRNSKKTAVLEMNNNAQLVYKGTQIGGQTSKTHTANNKILRLNAWNLIGIRVDGATYVKTYINDGTLSIDSHWLSVPYQNAAPIRLVLGQNPFENSPGNFFRGYIRSFKAWTVTNPSQNVITSLVSTSCGLGCSICGTSQSWCAHNEKWIDLDFQTATSVQVPDSSTYTRHANIGDSIAYQDTGVEPLPVGKQGVYFYQESTFVSVDSLPFPQNTFSFDIWFRFECGVSIPGEASLFTKSYLTSDPTIPSFSVRATTSALNIYLMTSTAASVSYSFGCTQWHNILLFVRQSGASETDVDVSINNDHSSPLTIAELYDEAATSSSKAVIGGAGFTGFIAFLQITNYYKAPYSTITNCAGVVCPLRTSEALPVCASGQYYDTASQSCQPCHADCPLCIGPLSTDCIFCIGYTKLTPTPIGACLPLECDARCDTCTGPYNSDCITCAVGVPDAQGLCHCDWDQEYSELTNDCIAKPQPCFDSNCQTCSGPLQPDCSSCKTAYFLLTDTFQCLADQCPVGYYTDLALSECSPGTCDTRCVSCEGPLLTDCLQCKGPEIAGLCTCPSSTYFNPTSNLCENCSSNCITCTSSLTCVACDSGYLLKGGQCFLDSSTICPAASYFNPTTSQCQSKNPAFISDCHQSCLTCYSSTSESCLTCPSDKLLTITGNAQQCLDCFSFPGLYYDSAINKEQCIQVCGDGIILDQHECDDGGTTSNDGCSSDCTVQDGYTCSGQPSVCIDSKNPYILKVTLLDESTVEVQFSEPMAFLTDPSFQDDPNNPLFQLVLSRNQECLDSYDLKKVNLSTVKLLLSYKCSINNAQLSVDTSSSSDLEPLLSDLAGNTLQK